MSYHVAVVEDDPDTLENYVDALTHYGYRVSPYTTTEAALEAFNQESPDLTILDIHLNDQPNGGFHINKQINKISPEKPTLFISGKNSEIDKIMGLQMGAWDFIGKPVEISYLTERVRSLIQISERRKERPVEVIPYSQVGLRIDESRLTIHWYGNRVEMTMTEFSILNLIASKPGRVRSYDELKAITKQRYVETNTINGHIRRIRNKLKRIDPQFKSLKNVHGMGYRWLE